MAAKRTIIVVWTWSEPVKPPVVALHGHDLWLTLDDHYVICADIRKNAPDAPVEWLKALENLIEERLKLGEVLVLLHSTSPHDYDESDRLVLLQALSSPLLRIRLFGGGKEPLYHTWHNEYGLLGLKGRFADLVETYGPEFREKKSTLVVDEAEKRLSQTHFDVLWAIYWHQPKWLVFQLVEHLGFWGSGYDPSPDICTLPNYLRQEPLLWQCLAQFAGVSVPDADAWEAQTAEFNLPQYEQRLEPNDPISAQLQKTRASVKQALEDDTCAGTDGVRRIQEVYNDLFALFQQIPEHA